LNEEQRRERLIDLDSGGMGAGKKWRPNPIIVVNLDILLEIVQSKNRDLLN